MRNLPYFREFNLHALRFQRMTCQASFKELRETSQS